MPAAWRAVPFIEPFGRPTEVVPGDQVDVRGNRGSLAARACWSRLAILVWDDGMTRRSAIVTRGTVGEVPFRRLRVRMRFELPSEASSGPRM